MNRRGGGRTFQEAVVLVTGDPEGVGYEPRLHALKIAPSTVSAPAWDPDGIYRLAAAGNRIELQVHTEAGWQPADLHKPNQREATQDMPNDEIKTLTRSILFMDVTGWSKLKGNEIRSYVTKGLPHLAQRIKNSGFLNTWGDAIVATFEDAKSAAESGLGIRDFFKQGYETDGIASGLSCRISLHLGEVMICGNVLTNRQDIFGHAVHVAARLEPATAPGHVFCTKAFADLLEAVDGLAPKAWPLGSRNLPKGFGQTEVFVVTHTNESDPRPSLQLSDAAPTPAPAPAPVAMSSQTAILYLIGWVKAGPPTGKPIRFDELDTELKIPPGSSNKFLGGALSSCAGWSIAHASEDAFILEHKISYDHSINRRII